ncbi:MAG: ABC transporter permease, partial [Lachnospiraceae bacterium]|nr:ABC transporter permease [Lachnospiraceae bacterium]
MELFRLEHKKLWRKNSTKICVLLCFFYCVIFGSFMIYQWITFGSRNDYVEGRNFDGYENIRKCQAYARKYKELTDESLQQWVRDFQGLKAQLDEERKTQGAEDWETVNKRQGSGLFVINGWISTLYPELEEADMRYVDIMCGYVKPEKLTGLYERREKAVETFLDISGQTGGEKEYLFRINEKVRKPFPWKWIPGWETVLGNLLADLGMVMALFFAIVLSSLFAGEWHDNTSSIILTTKNGWRQLAAAKILTGLSFTLELFAMVAVGMILLQLVFLGTEGWNMPIQMIKMIAIAPMNMLQAEIYEYAFTLLGAVGFAGVVMLFSARCKNQVLALLLSLAVVYGAMAFKEKVHIQWASAFDLRPLEGSG